jgi:hypothetical protein
LRVLFSNIVTLESRFSMLAFPDVGVRKRLGCFTSHIEVSQHEHPLSKIRTRGAASVHESVSHFQSTRTVPVHSSGTSQIDWLDAKCGCVGDSNCGQETPQGMMSAQDVEEWYDESADADYTSGTLLSIERWGAMKMVTFQKYNLSPFTSEAIYFKDLLTPFLPAWMQ